MAAVAAGSSKSYALDLGERGLGAGECIFAEPNRMVHALDREARRLVLMDRGASRGGLLQMCCYEWGRGKVGVGQATYGAGRSLPSADKCPTFRRAEPAAAAAATAVAAAAAAAAAA